MKRYVYVFLFACISAGAFEGYRRYTATSDTHEKRLAPPGEFYMRENFSLVSEHGISSLRPGRKLTLIKRGDDTWRLTTGKKEFDIPPSMLTRDLDLVDELVSGNKKVVTDFKKFSQDIAQETKQKATTRIAKLETSNELKQDRKRELEASLSTAQAALSACLQNDTDDFSNTGARRARAKIASITAQISGLDRQIAKSERSIVELKARQSKH